MIVNSVNYQGKGGMRGGNQGNGSNKDGNSRGEEGQERAGSGFPEVTGTRRKKNQNSFASFA